MDQEKVSMLEEEMECLDSAIEMGAMLIFGSERQNNQFVGSGRADRSANSDGMMENLRVLMADSLDMTEDGEPSFI